MDGHCIYIIEDLPVSKSIGNLFLIAPFPDLCLLVPFYFVNNATFFSMLYQGTIEYVANTWICVYMIVNEWSAQSK